MKSFLSLLLSCLLCGFVFSNPGGNYLSLNELFNELPPVEEDDQVDDNQDLMSLMNFLYNWLTVN